MQHTHTNALDGAPTVFRVPTAAGVVDMTVDQFVEHMVAKGYQLGSGQNVRLLACAAAEGGENSLAQLLANRLGATVQASADFVGVDSRGILSTFVREDYAAYRSNAGREKHMELDMAWA